MTRVQHQACVHSIITHTFVFPSSHHSKMITFTLVLPLLLFFSTSIAQGPIHVPLTRQSRVDGVFNPVEEAHRLRRKYSFINGTALIRHVALGRRASTAGVPIIAVNFESLRIYYALIAPWESEPHCELSCPDYRWYPVSPYIWLLMH